MVLGARILVCSLMAVLVIVTGVVDMTVLMTVVGLSRTKVVVKGRVLVRRAVSVLGLMDRIIVWVVVTYTVSEDEGDVDWDESVMEADDVG